MNIKYRFYSVRNTLIATNGSLFKILSNKLINSKNLEDRTILYDENKNIILFNQYDNKTKIEKFEMLSNFKCTPNYIIGVIMTFKPINTTNSLDDDFFKNNKLLLSDLEHENFNEKFTYDNHYYFAVTKNKILLSTIHHSSSRFIIFINNFLKNIYIDLIPFVKKINNVQLKDISKIIINNNYLDYNIYKDKNELLKNFLPKYFNQVELIKDITEHIETEITLRINKNDKLEHLLKHFEHFENVRFFINKGKFKKGELLSSNMLFETIKSNYNYSANEKEVFNEIEQLLNENYNETYNNS